MLKRVFFCSLLVFASKVSGGIVEEKLKQVPLYDRINMKIFFDEAIKRDQAGHVIYFQNKPICLTGPILKDKNKNFKSMLTLKGWLAFKKNEHLFPHPNFILSEEIHAYDDNFIVLDIYIINKKSFRDHLLKYFPVFKEILGENFSVDHFIAKLEGGRSLSTLLKKDEMLIGLLLGYGEESSQAFKETRTKCTKTFAPPQTETYQRIKIKHPKGCKIDPVVFMGNPHSSQVKELISIYEKELEKIFMIYREKKDPLLMFLEKLCEK